MIYIESRISNYIVRQVFWEMRIRLDTSEIRSPIRFSLWTLSSSTSNLIL